MPPKRSSAKVGAARGRPRSLAARRAVLEAARALVEKGGYAAATIEAISERSRVAKTTIYRSWPNRPALVVDLLMEMAGTAVPPPAVCPDPLKALRTEMYGIGKASDHITGRLLTSLLGEAQHDPEIRAALLDGLFRPRTDATSKVIRSAQRSGLLRKDVPARLAVDLLVGPIFYRMFVRHEPPSEAFVAHVFRVVMTGLEERR